MFYDIILMILPPHTSHLTQSLDVAIFSPLKQHMAVELHGIIETEIVQLQKVEWLSAYIRARERAFCISNILSAFSRASLFPFNPKKVLRRIPFSVVSQTIRNTTLDTDISPLQHPLLTSSPANITIFRAANNELQHRIATNSSLSTPERNYIYRLARSFEKLYARNSIKEQKNIAFKEVIHSRKNQLAGTRSILKDQHCVIRSDIYVQLAQKRQAAEEKKVEKKLNSRKRKRSNPQPSPDLSIDLTIFKLQDVDIHLKDDSQSIEDGILSVS